MCSANHSGDYPSCIRASVLGVPVCVECSDELIKLVAKETSKRRRYQLMVKHIALLAEDPHPLIYERAGGDCVCDKCGLEYFDHPKGSEKFLTLLCDGTQVKL